MVRMDNFAWDLSEPVAVWISGVFASQFICLFSIYSAKLLSFKITGDEYPAP